MIYKEVSETLGLTERSLESKKTYSGGTDSVARLLSSNWDDIDKASTVWEVERKIEKHG